MNAVTPQSRWLRGFAVASIVLGIFGGIFAWWVPFGICASIAGLVVSFVAGVAARHHSVTLRIAIVGFIVALVCLGVDILVAGLGWEIILMGGRT